MGTIIASTAINLHYKGDSPVWIKPFGIGFGELNGAGTDLGIAQNLCYGSQSLSSCTKLVDETIDWKGICLM